mmetsp:Transcript_34664/g.67081  ORF Transcript_34664/g.67081 Transcript_34664/m.67081 type:complete len:231 (+) Transcript_34664:947-1639(+)
MTPLQVLQRVEAPLPQTRRRFRADAPYLCEIQDGRDLGVSLMEGDALEPPRLHNLPNLIPRLLSNALPPPLPTTAALELHLQLLEVFAGTERIWVVLEDSDHLFHRKHLPVVLVPFCLPATPFGVKRCLRKGAVDGHELLQHRCDVVVCVVAVAAELAQILLACERVLSFVHPRVFVDHFAELFDRVQLFWLLHGGLEERTAAGFERHTWLPQLGDRLRPQSRGSRTIAA